MDNSRFWQLIDAARSEGESADPDALRVALSPLPNGEVIAFSHEFTRKLCELNKWSIWGAGAALLEGMSDDSFHYFRSWIIGKGLVVYGVALANPDDIADFVLEDEIVDNESLEYVAIEILEERGVEDPRESIDLDADGDPSGEPFDEDELEDLYPKCSITVTGDD
jgi:hypothetical protein